MFLKLCIFVELIEFLIWVSNQNWDVEYRIKNFMKNLNKFNNKILKGAKAFALTSISVKLATFFKAAILQNIYTLALDWYKVKFNLKCFKSIRVCLTTLNWVVYWVTFEIELLLNLMVSFS